LSRGKQHSEQRRAKQHSRDHFSHYLGLAKTGRELPNEAARDQDAEHLKKEVN
jgi:hypothetical protein